jgi:hypothetical protein
MSFDLISNLQSLSRRMIRCLILIAALTLLGSWNSTLFAQEAATAPATVEAPHGAAHNPAASSDVAHESHQHKGLPIAAPEVPFLKIGPLDVTNSMVLTWVVAILIIIFARVATAHMKDIPDGAQNFWEWMVESLSDFLASIIGEKLARRTFGFLRASLFSSCSQTGSACCLASARSAGACLTNRVVSRTSSNRSCAGSAPT